MPVRVVLACLMLLALPGPEALAGARGKNSTTAWRNDFDVHFRKSAKHYFGVGTDWTWFKAQAAAESNLRPDAHSAVKARGIMQLMPATYAELQKKNPELGDIEEPRWNIAAGISYDRQLWNRLGDIATDDERRRFMFAAYNAGPATISRARRVAQSEGETHHEWRGVSAVAPRVPRWRHRETLGYITRIETFKEQMPRE
jgi:membrane-bound lytic murein transglycosylase F